jgi:hypothetical protein
VAGHCSSSSRPRERRIAVPIGTRNLQLTEFIMSPNSVIELPNNSPYIVDEKDIGSIFDMSDLHADDALSPARTSSRTDKTMPSSATKKSTSIKHVSFDQTPQIHYTEHHSEYSQEERLLYWFQDYEILEIKQQASAISKGLRKNTPLSLIDEDEQDALELWVRSKKTAKERKVRWLMALSSVLDEQAHQRERSIHDPIRLAKRYRCFSAESEKIARSNASKASTSSNSRKTPSRPRIIKSPVKMLLHALHTHKDSAGS